MRWSDEGPEPTAGQPSSASVGPGAPDGSVEAQQPSSAPVESVSPDEPTAVPPSSASVGTTVPADAAAVTGDHQIDAALARLDRVSEEPLAVHIEAAEQAHEVLQGRLSDLGGG